MLESFDDLHLLGDAGVMLEHFEQGVGAFVDVGGLCLARRPKNPSSRGSKRCKSPVML